jgi:hypothetical protein
MDQLIAICLNLLPLVPILLLVLMLRDWYYHARRNRQLWLLVIIFGNVLGYIFFLYSSDRD